MNRAIALSVLLASAACVDNRSSIEIDGRAEPSDPTTCTFAPGGLKASAPGLLDVGSSAQPSYSLVVYMINNLSNPATASPPIIGQVPTVVASSKAWTANAAKVRINPSSYTSSFAPNPALLAFQGENSVPLDGQTIQPGGGASTQFVEAVSGPLGAELAPLVAPGEVKRIVLGITLQGRTLDGAGLDTAEWYFPVDVCNGCLVAPTTCPTGQTLTATNCFGPGQDSAPVCK